MKQTLLNQSIYYLEVYLLNGKLPTVGGPSGDQTEGAAAGPHQACRTTLSPPA